MNDGLVAGACRWPVGKATKGKLTDSFDFTTLYTGIQAAFLAAAAVGAVVVATRFGAKWVKKALGSIS
jgi:fluoride ion exporter CrcB/FEX